MPARTQRTSSAQPTISRSTSRSTGRGPCGWNRAREPEPRRRQRSNGTAEAYGATIAAAVAVRFRTSSRRVRHGRGWTRQQRAGRFSTVARRHGNTVAEDGDAALGGEDNNGDRHRGTVSGGKANQASGFASMIPGGHSTTRMAPTASRRALAHTPIMTGASSGPIRPPRASARPAQISSSSVRQAVCISSGGPLVCADASREETSSDSCRRGRRSSESSSDRPTTQPSES